MQQSRQGAFVQTLCLWIRFVFVVQRGCRCFSVCDSSCLSSVALAASSASLDVFVNEVFRVDFAAWRTHANCIWSLRALWNQRWIVQTPLGLQSSAFEGVADFEKAKHCHRFAADQNLCAELLAVIAQRVSTPFFVLCCWCVEPCEADQGGMLPRAQDKAAAAASLAKPATHYHFAQQRRKKSLRKSCVIRKTIWAKNNMRDQSEHCARKYTPTWEIHCKLVWDQMQELTKNTHAQFSFFIAYCVKIKHAQQAQGHFRKNSQDLSILCRFRICCRLKFWFQCGVLHNIQFSFWHFCNLCENQPAHKDLAWITWRQMNSIRHIVW